MRNKLLSSRPRLWIFTIVGFVSLIFSFITYYSQPVGADYYDMMAGMFAGFGVSLFAVGVIGLIRLRLMSAEKRRRIEIEINDERNKMILAFTFQATAIVAMLCMSVMAFLFVGLGYTVPAYTVAAAIYAVLLTMIVASRVYRKKL